MSPFSMAIHQPLHDHSTAPLAPPRCTPTIKTVGHPVEPARLRRASLLNSSSAPLLHYFYIPSTMSAFQFFMGHPVEPARLRRASSLKLVQRPPLSSPLTITSILRHWRLSGDHNNVFFWGTRLSLHASSMLHCLNSSSASPYSAASMWCVPPILPPIAATATLFSYLSPCRSPPYCMSISTLPGYVSTHPSFTYYTTLTTPLFS